MPSRPKAKAKRSSPPGEPSDLELLRVNNLLIGLDDDAFKAFAKRCRLVVMGQGDVLIEHGSYQDSAFFVIKGAVRIFQGDGRKVNIVHGDIEEGGWFGEVAAIDRGQRTASAHALRAGLVAVAPRAVFVNLLLEHRHIAVQILESFATLIRSSNQRMAEVSAFSGIQRVYLRLLDLAQPDPSGDGRWRIEEMPSHEQLGIDASTSKEAVAKAISQLLQDGVAKRSRRILMIHDREALRRLVTQI